MDAQTSGPRSLTQSLRERDEAGVARLLLARPDLAFPTPTDFSQVASRATTRHSVTQALATLDAFQVWVATRVVQLDGPVAAVDVAGGEADESDVRAALDHLAELALVWGQPLRPVRALTALLADTPVEPVPPSTPPAFDGAGHQSLALVDQVSAGSAFEFVRRMEVLVEHCDHVPPRMRRSGGFATREVKTLAALLDVPSATATGYLEIALAARLLALTDADRAEVLLPTTEFDSWEAADLAEQWHRLAAAWFDRHPASGPRWLKRMCLDAVPDTDPAVVLTGPELRSWIAWRLPRRDPAVDRQVSTMLEQAAWVGVTGLGAVASFARSLDVSRLERLLPERVEHVLLQADLTAIAPGPLTAEAARDLAALADVESRGGATVYRFSPESLRRAFGMGWTADEIETTLRDRSSTAVPQPLSYLVHDLDRQRHRTGLDRSYDPAFPGLHRPPRRSVPPTTSADSDDASPRDRLDEPAAAAIAAALLRDDDDVPLAEPSRPAGHAAFGSPLDALREAAETGETVWFGFVDGRGTAGERLAVVTSVEDGRLEARDARSGEGLSVPTHRITTAHIIRTRSGEERT